jgi:hypothetical protein
MGPICAGIRAGAILRALRPYAHRMDCYHFATQLIDGTRWNGLWCTGPGGEATIVVGKGRPDMMRVKVPGAVVEPSGARGA